MAVVVAGAGVFGASAALELARRGHEVTLLDPGPLPHPLAASIDISKVLRMEYGTGEAYRALMEEAFDGWRRWARARTTAAEESLYHETGHGFKFAPVLGRIIADTVEGAIARRPRGREAARHYFRA